MVLRSPRLEKPYDFSKADKLLNNYPKYSSAKQITFRDLISRYEIEFHR